MNEPVEVKKTKERSPSFPFIPLETALFRAGQFYEQEKRGAAPNRVAASHWRYSAASSGAIQTAAALMNYGLMSDEGSGANRKVRLTDLALRILLDQRPDSQEREQYKRQAALQPRIAQLVYEKWPDSLPSEPTLHHYLVLDLGFSEDASRKAIRILHRNETFTKGGAEDNLSGSYKNEEELKMLPSPQTVSTADAPIRTEPAMNEPVGMKQAILPLDDGQAVLRWPDKLSEESFADLRDWLELLLRKMARQAQASANEPKTDGKDE